MTSSRASSYFFPAFGIKTESSRRSVCLYYQGKSQEIMSSFLSAIFFHPFFSPLDKCICHTNRIKVPGRYYARPFKFGKTPSIPTSWNPQAPVAWPRGLLCLFRQVPRHINFCSVVRTGTTYIFWPLYCIKNIVEIKQTQEIANSMTPAIEELSLPQNRKETKCVKVKKERDLAWSHIKRKRPSRYTFKCPVRERGDFILNLLANP